MRDHVAHARQPDALLWREVVGGDDSRDAAHG